MTQAPRPLDVVARRVIRAAEEDFRQWIAVRDLDSDLLGTLYLRVLETLERQTRCDEAAVDDVALTIYLTISAWQPDGAPPLHLLTSLHRVVAATLAAESFATAPVDGARRNS